VPAQNRAGHVMPSNLFHSLGRRTAVSGTAERRLVRGRGRVRHVNMNSTGTSLFQLSYGANVPAYHRYGIGLDSIRCQKPHRVRAFPRFLPRRLSGVPQRPPGPPSPIGHRGDTPAELPDPATPFLDRASRRRSSRVRTLRQVSESLRPLRPQVLHNGRRRRER
jgi:hypothetical protein